MRRLFVIVILAVLAFFGWKYFTGGNMIEDVVDAAGDVAGAAGEAVSQAGEAAVENASEAADAAADAVEEAVDAASDAAEATTEAASDAVEAATETAGEAVENVTDAAESIVETVEEEAAEEMADDAALTGDKLREMLSTLGANEATMATLEPLIAAAENNPELLQQILDQAKAAMGQ